MSWQTVNINEICRPRQWKTIATSNLIPDGYPVYGANGKIGFYSEYTHEKPTLAITCRGATCGNVHISEPFSYINGNAMALDNLDIERVHIKFLYYFFLSRGFADVISGSAQPQITGQGLTKVFVPLPPLAEQKRIAAILDKADAIRRKRQQAIQLDDDFLKSVFLDMFGDPVTNPKGVRVATVAECLTSGIIKAVQDGNHGNDHPKVADFTTEGYPFVAANVVRNGQILFDKCYYLAKPWLTKLRIGFAKPRDVLLTHKGTLGLTAVLDDSFETYIFSPQTTYYRLNEERLLPEFLAAYFQSNYFQRLLVKEGKQSTRAYVGITRQKELPVMVPSINIQREFVNTMKICERMKRTVAKTSLGQSQLFESLSQKAFAGEL